MMREHQEIIKALQTQFQEYRRTAEVLFKAEAAKLEGRLHLQMEEYEEELNYVNMILNMNTVMKKLNILVSTFFNNISTRVRAGT